VFDAVVFFRLTASDRDRLRAVAQFRAQTVSELCRERIRGLLRGREADVALLNWIETGAKSQEPK
jgi:hypothetical protein